MTTIEIWYISSHFTNNFYKKKVRRVFIRGRNRDCECKIGEYRHLRWRTTVYPNFCDRVPQSLTLLSTHYRVSLFPVPTLQTFLKRTTLWRRGHQKTWEVQSSEATSTDFDQSHVLRRKIHSSLQTTPEWYYLRYTPYLHFYLSFPFFNFCEWDQLKPRKE